jgi:DNA-binding NtrC family response regulator
MEQDTGAPDSVGQDNTDATVLVVDDERLIRESIATYLTDSGFEVHQAEDGPTGLHIIELQDPDVVLLDLRMPEMDGLEVLAQVTHRWSELPVIVVTGAGSLRDAVEAMRLGAFDFISKPVIDMAIIEHAVCRAVERRRLRLENRRYNRHLESEVRSRTADLHRRTLQLQDANAKLEAEMAGHRRTEQALRRSQRHLSDVISIFEGFIYAVGKEYRLGFMNARLQAHVGADAPDGICHAVIYNRESPCPWCPLEAVLEGQTLRLELNSPRDNRWYSAVFSPQFGSGKDITGSQVIVMDIHDRKEAEIGLRLQADRLQAHNLRLRNSLQGAVRFGDIVGKSAAMHTVYRAILKAAESDANVIVYGESGTGKELVARTIHELSERGDKGFVPVNCGAIPENLFESEFFGYRKGAFSGADQDKDGFLTAAQNGTLFLDEVGEIPLSMQVKLLRAIEGGGYSPLGTHQVIRPDIRLVAATNRDLKRFIEQGRFRRDLYYRIHVVPIALPPLRERREDIPLLIHHFLQLFDHQGERQSIPDRIMRVMQDYHWPGNVRELQNAVQQYIAMQDLDISAGPAAPPGPPSETASFGFTADSDLLTGGPDLTTVMKRFEKHYIEKLLRDNKWHRTKVAALLGIDRRTLFRKIQALDIE